MSDTNPPGGGFGDHEPDDTFDTAAADPEQVARKLHRFRNEVGEEPNDWDELSEAQKRDRVELAVRLLAWLARSGHFR